MKLRELNEIFFMVSDENITQKLDLNLRQKETNTFITLQRFLIAEAQ
ncbi:MAG TPA: hypothetical protein PLS08_12095 [Chryseolinea sp.]|nr:hypothetical protein [Chryseolinea sp.]